MNAIHLKHMNYLNADERHLAKKHATITKDTAVGFKKWCKDNQLAIDTDHWGNITDDQLYDIYVKSLEG